MSDVYNANANRLDDERSEYELAQQIRAQQQIANRIPTNGNAVKTTMVRTDDVPDADSIDDDSVFVQAAAESRRNAQYLRGSRIEEQIAAATEDDVRQQSDQQQSITGPPHGFFYSIDYPVQVVIEHPDIVAARQRQQAESIDGAATLIRRPTIVQPDAQQLQLAAQQQSSRNINAEDLKLLPIRILDTKKTKRSDQSSRRRQAAIRNRFQRQFAVPMASAVGHNSKIPVHVMERSNNHNTLALPQADTPVAATPSEIVQIKSLDEQQREQELRRLAGDNADSVDAVHDAQVHPKQKAERAAAERRYRRHY